MNLVAKVSEIINRDPVVAEQAIRAVLAAVHSRLMQKLEYDNAAWEIEQLGKEIGVPAKTRGAWLDEEHG